MRTMATLLVDLRKLDQLIFVHLVACFDHNQNLCVAQLSSLGLVEMCQKKLLHPASALFGTFLCHFSPSKDIMSTYAFLQKAIMQHKVIMPH